MLLALPNLYRSLLTVGLFVVSVTISACYPYAGPAYPEEKISKIEPGKTTREQVYEALGQPLVVRENGRLTAYAESRMTAWVVSGAFWTRDGCAVQYDDNDIVSSISVFDDGEGCTDDGYCVRGVYGGSGGTVHESPGAIVFALETDDAAAKAFSVNQDRCAVFIYATGNPLLPIIVSRSDAEPVIVDKESYLFWAVLPGTLSFDAAVLLANEKEPPDISAAVEVYCEPGGLYFVDIDYDTSWLSGWAGGKLRWNLAAPADGKRRVRERRLVLE